MKEKRKPRRIVVNTIQGVGHIWDGVPYREQLERDAIAVCFDDGKPAVYYSRSEVEILKGKTS